jgi:hypothetical protein
MRFNNTNISLFVLKTIVGILLTIIVFRPISQFCMELMDEDYELYETLEEEDSEEEKIDDLEEDEYLLHDHDLLSFNSGLHELRYGADAKESDFALGVVLPPPENHCS